MMIHGTITKQLDDGTEAEAHYMIDTDTGDVVQVGGEAQICAEDIDIIKFMMTQRTDPETGEVISLGDDSVFDQPAEE